MKKSIKTWLSVAVILFASGAIPFAAIITMHHWDFSQISTVRYETNTHEIHEAFENISVTTDTADIVFLPSEDTSCDVICVEEESAAHAVSVENNTLTIKLIDERTPMDFISHIGLNFGSPKITVYLPESEYKRLFIDGHTSEVHVPDDFRFGDIGISVTTSDVSLYASALNAVKISVSTGDIDLDDISAASVDLTFSTGSVTCSSVNCAGNFTAAGSTGDIFLSDIECKRLAADTDSGNISLQDVIASENFKIKTDTGEITFTDCDAAKISAVTSTGSVSGNLLSEKIFFTETSTGSIDVPKSISGGICDIKTETGSIRITTP